MNEKMMILKMLEEGKITAEEAARLLESAGGEARQQAKSSAPPPEPRRAEPKDNRQTPPKTAHAASSGPGGFDDFTADLSKKFEQFARDVEPKLYKITEAVAEKTANVADMISKSLTSPGPSPSSAQQGELRGEIRDPGPAKKSFINMEEKIFEAFVSPGFNELNLSGLNGDVLIKGYNGDKISARIYYKPKRSGAKIDITKLGGKYFLNYEEDEFDKVAIDAFVPETMFNAVSIQTINGQLSVSTIKTESCALANANASTEVKDVAAASIKIDSTNGQLRLDNIGGNEAKIENFNGGIQAVGVDVSNMELITQNGSVLMNTASFDRFSEYVWAVEASNGKLTLNLPSSRDAGYHIKAHTTLSNIKVGLTGLNYIYNEPSFVEAKSTSYDDLPKRIRLSLETSNAPVVVN